MKVEYRIKVVLVNPDSARPTKRARAFEPFTTVRLEDRKRAAATRYGAFWSIISRRIL